MSEIQIHERFCHNWNETLHMVIYRAFRDLENAMRRMDREATLAALEVLIESANYAKVLVRTCNTRRP